MNSTESKGKEVLHIEIQERQVLIFLRKALRFHWPGAERVPGCQRVDETESGGKPEPVVATRLAAPGLAPELEVGGAGGEEVAVVAVAVAAAAAFAADAAAAAAAVVGAAAALGLETAGVPGLVVEPVGGLGASAEVAAVVGVAAESALESA